MKKPIRIIWGVFAVGLLTAYLLSGLNLSVKPQAMTWREFSANPEAVAHFAERSGIAMDGAAGGSEELRQTYEDSIARNPDIDSVHTRGAHNPLVTSLRNFAQKVYHLWQPGRDPAGRRVHHLTHFSGVGQLRWNIGMTLVVLILLIAAFTRVITSLERSLRV